MTGAVIDIGSNTIRLMVAEGDKIPEPLIKRIRTTRLAQSGGSLRLTYSAMARTIAAISAFQEEVKVFGKVPIAAFATAAVREAPNQNDFLAAVKQTTGLDVDVLSGETEAMLALLGAGDGEGGLLDIGGASTEIIWGQSGRIAFSGSFPVGCVRAKERFPESQLQDDVQPFFDFLDEQFALRQMFPAKWYGVGGTITTLGAVKKALKVYDPDIVHGSVIKADDIPGLLKRLRRAELRKNIPVLGSRQDIILYGTLILGYLMALLSIDQLTVSEADNMEGYWRAVFTA